jgi:L-ascorbate metabolism protein UlaG (beta-lactamase superfamily)
VSTLAVTWWGHSTATIELGPTRVLTDPLQVDRFVHLRRHASSPTVEVVAADLVLVSHLHIDHFHLPSLRRLGPGTPVIVPAGSRDLLARTGLDVHEASPGERLTVAGVSVEVTRADHPATRHRWSRKAAQPVGFRLECAGRSLWYPGDTGPSTDVSGVRGVDLALVPVGGWGPTLGDDHVGPEEAAELVRRVGARWAVPVHWGTFWPLGMGRVAPGVRRHLFETPGERFLDAVEHDDVRGVLAEQGHRIVLDA